MVRAWTGSLSGCWGFKCSATRSVGAPAGSGNTRVRLAAPTQHRYVLCTGLSAQGGIAAWIKPVVCYFSASLYASSEALSPVGGLIVACPIQGVRISMYILIR